jgi:CheY-like chemotaxis protein
VRQLRPDVLVLDLCLPDGDGYGVVDQLRRAGPLCDVPVVVYSAQQLDTASRERLRLGEMAFLTKGYHSPDELARRVVGIVRRVGMTDPVTEQATETVTAPVTPTPDGAMAEVSTGRGVNEGSNRS